MGELNYKKKKITNSIPFRLNILFLIVFLSFSILIIRLGDVQIVNGQNYVNHMQQTTHVTNRIQTARGLIFDRNGVLLASNDPSPGIMFTREQDMSSTDLINLARKLSHYLTVSNQKRVQAGIISTAKVTDRDLKDYWIGTHPNAYKNKLSASEQKNSKKAYKLLLTRITPKDLATISPDELKVVAIWRVLFQATNLSPTLIASHLSQLQLARIGEHLDQFGGAIDTTVASTRTYPKGDLFFLGNVSHIPLHELNNYLAEGLNRDDLVGVSNLEEEYNDVLSGVPKTLTYTTKNGKPVGSPNVKEGRRGDDLVLTVDYKFEQKVNQIIQSQIKQCYPTDHQCNQAYAVVMNPHTGGIIAISGQKYDGSNFKDVSEGCILNSFAIGSAIKGATVLAGFQNNAIPGYLNDKPIKFKDGQFQSMESWIGTVNTTQALEVSSNVYMGTIAAKMAGFQISDQGPNYYARLFNGNKFATAFKTLRDTYGQFGLGVHTGVDLPFESTGYQGAIPYDAPGKIMYFAIGQFDTYTPLQMAQYISTIANGGYRIAPHFMESIHYSGSSPTQIGPTDYRYPTKVLNKIPNTEAQIQVVHEGFHLVTHGPQGTARTLGNTIYPWAKYNIAAKTGTAEVGGKIRNNKTLIAYAPATNPEIAISIVVPNILNRETTNLFIAGNIFQAYFQSKKSN